MQRHKIITLALLAVTASSSAFAHHSQAMFDMDKCRTIKGTVRTFQFGFPHSWLWIVVPGPQGADDIWGFESAAPVQMMEVNPRWKRDVVNKGDKVTIRYSPMKDGRHAGALGTLALPDGSVLRAATPACAAELGPIVPAGAAAAGAPAKKP